jgi:diguanylate cyclase (GGDEF)-like protein
MDAYFLLALPRLHAELAALPEGVATLWPGLPRRPESAWAPAMPLSPSIASACLADYERACRDGASGAPVHALGAEHAPADLSDAERRALREMSGLPAEAPEQPLRQTAQQVLLLAWLQEKQALDMAELEKLDPDWVRSMRRGGVTSLVLVPLRRDNSIIGYLYVVNFDVTKIVEVKEMTELMAFFLTSEIVNYLLVNKLDHISKIDALTGINNRRAMIERMKDLTVACGTVPFGVVNIDLNGLKTVNDLQGHEAGDRLLIQAGEILRKVFYDEDLFRTGGDEFVVITSDISRETFEHKVERLRRDVLKNSEVSFAVGTFWTDGSVDVTTAFRNADERMYADKQLFYEIHPELRR